MNDNDMSLETMVALFSDPGMEHVNEIIKINTFLDPIRDKLIAALSKNEDPLAVVSIEEMTKVSKAAKDLVSATNRLQSHMLSASLPFEIMKGYIEIAMDSIETAQSWRRLIEIIAEGRFDLD